MALFWFFSTLFVHFPSAQHLCSLNFPAIPKIIFLCNLAIGSDINGRAFYMRARFIWPAFYWVEFRSESVLIGCCGREIESKTKQISFSGKQHELQLKQLCWVYFDEFFRNFFALFDNLDLFGEEQSSEHQFSQRAKFSRDIQQKNQPRQCKLSKVECF
jgi:hypothetical protein